MVILFFDIFALLLMGIQVRRSGTAINPNRCQAASKSKPGSASKTRPPGIYLRLRRGGCPGSPRGCARLPRPSKNHGQLFKRIGPPQTTSLRGQ